MARLQRIRKLNDAKSEVIADNILKQDPDGFEPTEDVSKKIVIAKEMPKYRKVIFINGRDPGVALHFHHSSKTHPLKHYTLFHGVEHELPEEVIEKLEECAENQYAYRKDSQGLPECYVSGKKYIFQFRTPQSQRRAA